MPRSRCLISITKSFINRENRLGDRTSHCFNSKGIGNQSVCISLTWTHPTQSTYRDFNALKKSPINPGLEKFHPQQIPIYTIESLFEIYKTNKSGIIFWYSGSNYCWNYINMINTCSVFSKSILFVCQIFYCFKIMEIKEFGIPSTPVAFLNLAFLRALLTSSIVMSEFRSMFDW